MKHWEIGNHVKTDLIWQCNLHKVVLSELMLPVTWQRGRKNKSFVRPKKVVRHQKKIKQNKKGKEKTFEKWIY